MENIGSVTIEEVCELIEGVWEDLMGDEYL